MSHPSDPSISSLSSKRTMLSLLTDFSVAATRRQVEERVRQFRRSVFPEPRNKLSPIVFEPKRAEPSVISAIDAAIGRTQRFLLGAQDPNEGFWHAKLDDNITLTASLIFFYRMLGLDREEMVARALNHIRRSQNGDGSWSIYTGGPGELSATVEAYLAASLAGASQDEPFLKRAEQFIVARGGLSQTRVFTKISLALFGFYPWELVPIIPPELMLVPRGMPFHILDFSYWSRSVIIPLTIIFHHRPNYRRLAPFSMEHLHVKRSAEQGRSRMVSSLEYLFELINSTVVVFERRSPIKPFRATALRRAEQWILDHQDETGDWGGIIPAMMNSAVALHLQGYPITHEILQRGIQSVERFIRLEGDAAVLQSCVSPIWDSAITGVALLESGLPPQTPALVRAAQWLMKKQIRRRGDWSHKADPGSDGFGAWAFQFHNDFFPDTDDTALVLQFLRLMEGDSGSLSSGELRETILRGLRWLEAMQCTNGGYGAFDKDNNKWFINQIPFADLKSLIDPSTPDVSGHVLETFALAGLSRTHPTVERLVQYLRASQEFEGCWFGRWGVNYIYGTSGALVGLRAIGEPARSTTIQRGLKWLLDVQNSDGGWGESCASYDDRTLMGRGTSTPSQTAWALMGLIAGELSEHPSTLRGIEYLLTTQRADGTWDEPEYTGTGFPQHFYLRYDYYRIYFPLLALARARRIIPSS